MNVRQSRLLSHEERPVVEGDPLTVHVDHVELESIRKTTQPPRLLHGLCVTAAGPVAVCEVVTDTALREHDVERADKAVRVAELQRVVDILVEIRPGAYPERIRADI